MKAPGIVYVTLDHRYGTWMPHESRESAKREHRREPKQIEVVEYVPRSPCASDPGETR